MTSPGGENRNANVVLTADTSQYQAQMAQSTQSTNHLSSALSTLTSHLDGLGKRAGKRLFQFSAVDFAGLAGMTATAATFEKQLGTLRATADVTSQSFGQMKGNIENTFTKFPVARGEVVQLTSAISQLGITSTQTLGSLTNTFIKLGAATGENSSDLAGGLVQLSRLMGTTNAQQIGNFANSLLTVSKNAGVAAGGVLNFAQSIAPLARQAGISEAAVLGISTAFTKAGADGYVAANTFNSMVSDITNLVQTGSPELEKYAKLIGVTTGQFAKMDKTNALIGIFEAINKQGPKAIQTLNQLGFEGIRAQAAITAVVQSGNLRQSVAQALGSSNDQGNLNKASKDAMEGLTDSLVQLRNNFTQLGTEIGTTFLTPLTKVLEIFNKMFEIFNKIIKPFAPIIGAVGALAGALTGLAGAALITFGIITKLATLKLLATGSPLLAFRQGVAVGRDPTVVNAASVRAAEGTLKWYQRPAFVAGAGLGRTLGPAPETVGPSVVSRVAGVPFAGAAWLANTQSQLLRDSTFSSSEAFQRSGQPISPTTEPIGFFGRIGAGFRSGYNRWVTPPPPPATLPASAASAPGPSGTPSLFRPLPYKRMTPETMGAEGAGGQMSLFAPIAKSANDAAKATKAGTAATIAGTAAKDGEAVAAKGFSVRVAEASGAVARLGVASLRAGASLVVGAGGLAARGAGAVLRSPIGLLSLSFLLPSIISGVKGLFSGGTDYSKALDGNNIQRYDEKLGQSSSNLATFSTAVTRATDKLNSLAGKPVGDVRNIPGETSIAAQRTTYQAVDKTFASFKQGDKKSIAAGAAYIQSLAVQHGGLDAAYLYQIEQDLVNQTDPKTAQKVIDAYFATKKPGSQTTDISYRLFGQQGRTGAPGVGTGNIQDLNAQAFSTANAQFLLKSDTPAARKQLSSLVAYSSQVLANRHNANAFDDTVIKNIKNEFTKLYGFAPTGTDFTNPLETGTQLLVGLTAGSTRFNKEKYVRDESAETTAARRKLDRQLGLSTPQIKGLEQFNLQQENLYSGGDITKLQYEKRLAAYYKKILPGSDIFAGSLGGRFGTGINKDESNALSALGGLGIFAATDKTIQSVSGIGGLISNPREQAKAQNSLVKQSVLMTGNLGNAATALQKLADTAERNADPALQALAESASQFARGQYEQTVLPTLNRTQQTQYYAGRLKSTRQEYLATGTDSSKQDYQGALSAYNQQIQSNEQFFVQMYQTTRNYHIQMTRSDEDYNKQLFRTQQDFQIQMAHSERDYLKQRFRQTRDFNIQLKQQALSSAQSIYNPFQRIYDQQVADAGSVLMNLKDQNQRIQDQYANLKKLQASGVSQQTIDVLNLADPSNAQQLQQLVAGITNNPSLVRAINAAVNQRQKATTQLTQSDFNATFRQTTDAFHRSFHDMAKDFNTSRNDAEKAEHLGLQRMGEDYSKMLDRSAEDLKNSILDITQSFGDLYPKVFNKVADYIRKFAPQAANIIQASLDSLRLPGQKGGNTVPWTQPGAGTKSNPITTPLTHGMNEQGQIGYYGKGGKWFPISPQSQEVRDHTGKWKQIAPPGSGYGYRGMAYEQQQTLFHTGGFNTPVGGAEYGFPAPKRGVESSNTHAGEKAVEQMFPGVQSYADTGRVDQFDHPWGKALDNMIPNYNTKRGVALGWRVANFFADNSKEFGVKYILWKNWQNDGSGFQWDPDASLRAQHQNHVHVSFYDQGGVLEPGMTKAMNTTGQPELILSPQQMKAMHTVGKGTPATNIFKIYNDNSTIFRDITVMASDPNMMAKQLMAKARLAKLARPPRATSG